MKIKLITLFLILVLSPIAIVAQKSNVYEANSPDGTLVLKVEAAAKLQWSVQYKGQPVIVPSSISLVLGSGEVLGDNAKVLSAKTVDINTQFNAINFRRNVIADIYTQLTINCKNDFGVIFRIYNDAVAYRFFTKKKDEIIIKNEEANFNFANDYKAFIPIQWDYRGGAIFNSSFEAMYHEINISQFPKDSLAFLPLLVDLEQNRKVEVLEADLEDYPGMYLDLNQTRKGFKGVYAQYPLETKQGGYADMNVIPTKRAGFIAKTLGTRSFPWRIITFTTQDKDLLNCDIVQKLASPSRISDVSWIQVGQVSWDWWNDYNITHVDFKAGMNTATFKYYIDFASANKAKYIILDAGWSETFDLNKINPDIDLTELLNYAKNKNVGLILWASWYTITQQMKEVFPKYAKMGVKGWKIDFIDRDDQIAVASTYEIAKLAAGYKLMVDYHGMFKPTGLQRTYPNVVGFEGVYGLENFKWADKDAPRYAVTIPFIRNLAGPMDYTSGAMINSSQANFKARNHAPMSKGTRCHQLAQYVVFEVPIQMLSDNPSIYMKEQECTDFITSIPTTFDETLPLDSKVAEYLAVARKKGNTWYVGAMTNWTPRELSLDFSFLGEGNYEATVFKDGLNADREATDYKKEVISLKAGDKLTVKLMNGGGWAARIEKK